MMTESPEPRLDEEYRQALTRLILAAAGAAVCLASGLLTPFSEGVHTSILIAVYWVYALAWTIAVKRWPGVSVVRRVAGMAGDVALTSVGIYLMGELGPMFYPLYLWIIVGNGMRFGARYLYTTLATATIGLSAVVYASAYWQEHLTLGVSLMLGLVLLPMFYVTVIWRLHASNAQLAEALRKSEAATTAQADLAHENARLLREAEAAAVALRDKNAELDSFVYTVSHDLKAPLVTIQGMAGLLAGQHGETLDDEGRRYLERIDVNAHRMEGLLLDLLSLARIGREARTPERIDLPELVEELAAELAPGIRARGIALTVGALPTVWGVRVHLEQLLRNLLTNAMKYLGDQSAPVIEIGGTERGAFVECWVRDNGIGIDRAYHEKVFELFQRLKEVDAEGTGVGLPIVKKIVEAAGGCIWVESTPGQGSTFRFTWPSHVPHASPVSVASDEGQP